MSDNLGAFARWFLSQSFPAFRPPQRALYRYTINGGEVQSLVLHRAPPFQVELFTLVPFEGVEIGGFPEHRHPNVDSIEVFLTGDVRFTIAGNRVFSDERLAELAPDGTMHLYGQRIRVRPTTMHGGTVGPTGGAFLSIQRWLNGVLPTSVGLDWDGPPHVDVRAP